MILNLFINPKSAKFSRCVYVCVCVCVCGGGGGGVGGLGGIGSKYRPKL